MLFLRWRPSAPPSALPSSPDPHWGFWYPVMPWLEDSQALPCLSETLVLPLPIDQLAPSWLLNPPAPTWAVALLASLVPPALPSLPSPQASRISAVLYPCTPIAPSGSSFPQVTPWSPLAPSSPQFSGALAPPRPLVAGTLPWSPGPSSLPGPPHCTCSLQPVRFTPWLLPPSVLPGIAYLMAISWTALGSCWPSIVHPFIDPSAVYSSLNSFVCLSVCLSVCLFVCLSIFHLTYCSVSIYWIINII